MTERPILFSAPMVRAILAGQKTQTRRVITGLPENPQNVRRCAHYIKCDAPYRSGTVSLRIPLRTLEGDRLWVRETWCQPDPTQRDALYRADCDEGQLEMEREVRREIGPGAYVPWKPSIHMPRWASRITLDATLVRVQRLQEISEADALAEGVDPSEWTGGPANDAPRAAFAELWDRINGKRPGCSWEANPWVRAVSFKRAEAEP